MLSLGTFQQLKSKTASHLPEKKKSQAPKITSSSTYREAEFSHSSPLKNLISKWQGSEHIPYPGGLPAQTQGQLRDSAASDHEESSSGQSVGVPSTQQLHASLALAYLYPHSPRHSELLADLVYCLQTSSHL